MIRVLANDKGQRGQGDRRKVEHKVWGRAASDGYLRAVGDVHLRCDEGMGVK